ncbi:U1 small nuclear ribonucleoprotein 70 kDa [Citrus sinensis]|nr:U1 small nuclear ribonucleoprotein 70 kDa [Citrus sinensis]
MGDYNDAFMRNQNAAVQARTKAQNRANVLQLKLIGQSHPTGLTANLLKLFEPRAPLEYKPPPEKRKCPPLTGLMKSLVMGMAQFVSHFAEPGDPLYAPPVEKAETPVERRARIHKLRLEKGAEKAAEELKKYDPHNDPNVSGDPYKTLFVARLSYETTESKIKREFESYGPIKRLICNSCNGGDSSRDGKPCDEKVRLVTDKETNKPRGYAFIEYMHTRDMKAAYKQADGRKLDGRRVLVDVERGRTVPNWRPRRLGGGLGTTRVGGEEVNQRYSGREQEPSRGPSRSAEPRIREDRHGDRDRERSRERGRDREREREKSLELSHDRPRDRDHRDDRHHRDRDRTRDRERERDRGRERDRDRTRDRDRGRDRGRDHERDREKDRDKERDRDRTRERERDRDYEVGDPDRDRGYSRDRDSDYDRIDSKHERDRHGERDYDPTDQEDDRGWYDHHENYEHHRGYGDHDRYNQYHDDDNDRYDQMEEDDYRYDRATSESRDKERTRDLDREY